MLNQYKRKRDEGFTIIEVMIVLAIAGLIMLVVFLAVPALQRNARNTQRTQDVGQIGTGAQNVINNNNGDMTQLTSANLRSELPKLAYYTSTNVSVASGSGLGAVTNGTDVDHVVVYTGATCAAMTGGQGATPGTSRQLAVVYSTEGGSGGVPNCKPL